MNRADCGIFRGKETSRLGSAFSRWFPPLLRTDGFFLTCKDLPFFKKKGNKETSQLGFTFSRWFLPLPQTGGFFLTCKDPHSLKRKEKNISAARQYFPLPKHLCLFPSFRNLFFRFFKNRINGRIVPRIFQQNFRGIGHPGDSPSPFPIPSANPSNRP